MKKLFITGFLPIFGLILVWLVLSKTYMVNIGTEKPDTFLSIISVNSAALLKQAENVLKSHSQEKDPQFGEQNIIVKLKNLDLQTGKLIEEKTSLITKPIVIDPETNLKILARIKMALSKDPLNAKALRILAQLTQKEDGDTRAKNLMLAASSLSKRESLAVYWLMVKFFQDGNYSESTKWADVLLRTQPQIVRYVTPYLSKMAENSEGMDEVKRILASNPPWRNAFFHYLPANITDARTPLILLLSIKETNSPPTLKEIRSYLKFLIGRKLYDIAYYSWLQFLTPEQLTKAGFLYNGSFESNPSGLQFDWTIRSGSGVSADIVIRPDHGNQHALFLQFDGGRVDFRGVRQMIMLPPGIYRLEGEYMGQIVGRRGLVWRAFCSKSPRKPIGQSSMVLGITRSWKKFDLTINVPKQNCQAQYIQLFHDARSASEQLISGHMWYDNLLISQIN